MAGVEAEDLEEDTAKRWVGKAEESGALDDGLSGASRDGGKRDRGNELGMESRFTAASILNESSAISEGIRHTR